MNVRALHFDMKGLIPRPDYMLTLVERIARLGYNCLLVEFEDKFPFAAFPHMVHPAAYSKEEFRALDQACRAHGVGIAPLLQSVGHLDYFLKHPKYRTYREAGSSYQWCLSDPRTLEVWKAMADELLEVFPGCEYVHIGADEVMLDSSCVLCGQADRFQLFLNRVEACVDYLRGKGKKVVMWDDMFRARDLTRLGGLLEKVIPCIWQYGDMDESLLRRFADAGCQFWGASNLQADFRYRGMCAQIPRQKNVDDWMDMNRIYEPSGHVGTIWGRVQCQTPLEANSLPQSLFMIAYLGQSMTQGNIQDARAFARRFGAEVMGLPDMDIVRVVENFSYEPDVVKAELEKWQGQGSCPDILAIWQVFNEIDVLYRSIDRCFCVNGALLPACRAGMVPDHVADSRLEEGRVIARRTEALKSEIDRALSPYFPQPVLDEFKAQRFDAMLEQNARWGRIIAQAKASRRI